MNHIFKEVFIWILILAGPVLSYLGMRKHRISWNTTGGIVALISAAVTIVAGALLFKMF